MNRVVCVKILVRGMITRKIYSVIPLCANPEFRDTFPLVSMSD